MVSHQLHVKALMRKLENLGAAFLGRLPAAIRGSAIKKISSVRYEHALRSKPLKWVTLFITNVCNARCSHCFYWQELNTRKPEMNLQQLKKTFGSLKGRLRTLRLSGGEPFLRKDLADFFIYVDQNRIADKFSIPTHGMLEVLPMIEKMLDRDVSSILNVNISLDGLEERHNASRKVTDGFSKAIANLRRMVTLAESNSHFIPSVYISLNRQIALPGSDGESEAEKLTRFLLDDVGVKTVGFDHIRSGETDVYHLPHHLASGFSPPPIGSKSNRHSQADPLQLSTEEMRMANDRLEKVSRADDRLNFARLEQQVRIKETQRRLVDCLAGVVDCVVYPTGDVAACEFTRPFANLSDFDFDLDRLWHSDAAESRRRDIRGCACTHPCHLSDSLAYDGSFLSEYLPRR